MSEAAGRTQPGEPKTDGVGSAGPYAANDAYDKGEFVGGQDALKADASGDRAAATAVSEIPPELAARAEDIEYLDDTRAKDADTVESSGVLHKARRFCSEGHTVWDALLSTASSAVGQVILTYPYQLALMGIIPGIIVGIGVGLLNYWTLFLLIILYLQRKKDMVRAGTWYNAVDSNGYLRRKTVTQYHDVVSYSLGYYPFGLAGQLLVALYVLGVAIQQLVASSSSQYTIDKSYDKRTWTLILGAPILIFGLLPSFRSVRLLNIIALVGTNYSCLYFLIAAAGHGRDGAIMHRRPQSVQGFFLGAAVVGSAGHSISMEMMDGMRRSRKFAAASFLGWVWNIILLQPHSIAIVLAYPNAILKQANVYALLPNNGWKYFSVYIMLVHNIGAFTLHTNPLLYMWEKLIHTHHLTWWIRIPSRIPVLAAIWVLSLAIPFYGTINSLFSAISIGLTAFVLPTLAFNWHYRTEERRRNCPVQPPWPLNKWGWKPLFAFNMLLFLFFLSTSTVCGIYYSIKQLINNIHTFHWFAACYQCPTTAAVAPAIHHAPAPAPHLNHSFAPAFAPGPFSAFG